MAIAGPCEPEREFDMTKTYRLVREQMVGRPLEDVFAFFADARNLEILTPPWLRFQILTPGQIEMRVGTIIQYALKVHGVPMHWTTAITIWKPPYEFVDVQLRGPYVLWHHRHTFESLGERTRMTDQVEFALPLGLVGRTLYKFVLARDLTDIFDFRERAIERSLASSPVPSGDSSNLACR